VTCSLAIDTFDPENTPALGFRVFLGQDLYGDEISYVRGNVRIEVVASLTDGTDDHHARVEALARIADRTVTRAMTFQQQ
jgi:hypothetical protein